MQRTDRRAIMLSRPSKERDSAGLNLTELQRGHLCFAQINCGNQWGHFKLVVLKPISLQARYWPLILSTLECDSSQASSERMLPVAIAMQESAAP
jgi:hypothetical protein